MFSGDVYGTFGWSTLMDEVNKIIVFAKPSSNIRTSRISYLPIGNLTAYPKLVKDIDGDLLKRYNYKGMFLSHTINQNTGNFGYATQRL